MQEERICPYCGKTVFPNMYGELEKDPTVVCTTTGEGDSAKKQYIHRGCLPKEKLQEIMEKKEIG